MAASNLQVGPGPREHAIAKQPPSQDDLYLRNRNQEHQKPTNPLLRMGYADEEHARRKFATTWRTTRHEDTMRVLTATSDRREYMKDAPAGKLLHLRERSRDNQVGEGGGARKEKRWRISKGASICCAGTHKTKTFCVREQRVPRILKSNSQAPGP